MGGAARNAVEGPAHSDPELAVWRSGGETL